MASNKSKAQPPWFEAYPPPKNLQSKTVTREELRQWILDGQKPGKDFLLVDVRRDDHGVIGGNSWNFMLGPCYNIF
jgi:arsenical-resistance protein 2